MKKPIVSALLTLASICPLMAQEGEKQPDIKDWIIYPFNQPGDFSIGLGAGAAFFGDGAVDVNNNRSGAADLEIETGYSLALRAGRNFGPLRFEGEFHYVEADISAIDSSTGPISVNSNLTSIGLMGNALWDFDFKPFTLSVGGGLGFTHLNYEQMTDQENVLVAGCSKSVFAGQFIVGLGYEINEYTKLGLNYRYMMMSGLDDRGKVDTNALDSSDISFESVGVSIVELSVIWKF